MKLKQLESFLQQLETFPAPKVELEQYPTSPHLAAQLLFAAATVYNDIIDKTVLDLGCGTGILGIGAQLLGSSYTVGVDIDPEALCVAQANVDQLGVEIDFLNADVLANLTQQAKSETATSTLLKVPFDTVIMNPPFGTKNQKHADYLFLKQAVKLSNHAVYSLHKSSTRAFLQRKAAELNLKLEVVAELRFDISNLYKFHKKNSVDVEVDLIRFSKQPAENQS